MSEPIAENYSAPKVESIEDGKQRLGNNRGRKSPGPLQPTGGGGTSGGMELWQQTVETRLGELRTDIRGLATKLDTQFLWLLGSMGAGFLILAGLIGRSAKWW